MSLRPMDPVATGEGRAMSRSDASKIRSRWALLAATLSLLAGIVVWAGCSDKGSVNPFNPGDVPLNFIGSMTASPGRVNAGDQEALVTVFVIDENGTPVSGIEVAFVTDMGSVDEMVVTDEEGYARATFTSGVTEGSAHVTASLGTYEKEVVIQIGTQGGEGGLIAAASSIIADGTSTTTLTAQILDNLGQPRSGLPVFFESSSGFITPTAFTDNDGTAEATLRSVASGVDVEAFVTAKIADPLNAGQFVDVGDAFTTFRGISIDVNIDRTMLVADGEDKTFVRTIVKETTSQVTVPEVIVSYGTTRGSISNTAMTDATGLSVATLFAGVDPGNATITATLFGAIRDSVSADFTPLTLAVVGANPTTLPSDGTSQAQVTVLLLNASNNPIANKVITFSTTAGVISSSALTDDDGKAIATLTAPSAPGTASVIANFGTLSDTIQVEISSLGEESGVAATIALLSVEYPSIGVAGTGQNATSELVFEVRDATGQPVIQDNAVNVDFSFSASPGGGAYLSPLSVGTDAQGRVRTSINSGTVAGAAKVRATVAGSDPLIESEVVSVAINGGPPDLAHFSLAIELANIPGRLLFGVENKITAFLFDKYSNPVAPGTVVWFSTNRGGITGSATTNAVGQAVATLYSAAPTPSCADTGYAYVIAQTIDEFDQTISTDVRALFSGASQIGVVYPASASFTVPDGGSVPILFYVGDDCGNPLVGGTFINFEFEGDGGFIGDTSVQLSDTQSQGATFYAVTVYDATTGDALPPSNCFINVTVTNSDNGNISFIYTGTVD